MLAALLLNLILVILLLYLDASKLDIFRWQEFPHIRGDLKEEVLMINDLLIAK